MPRVSDWQGITKTAHGYLVRVKVGTLPRAAKRFPIGTPLAEMQDWREATRRALADEWDVTPRGTAGPGTLAEDVRRYLASWGTGTHPETVRQRRRHLEEWAQAFPGRRRATLTVAEITAQLEAWQRRNPRGRREGASTWNKRRQALLQVFAWCLRDSPAKNLVEKVPTREEPPAQARGIPYPIVRAILTAMPRSKTRARLGVIAFTGLRPEEVRRIQAIDINWTDSTLYVRTAKRGPVGTIPLMPEALAWLREFADLRAFGLFYGGPIGKSFGRAVRAVNRQRASEGLPALVGIRPYDLRHSFGTELYRATRDLKVTAAGLRQKSLRMTERYIEAAVPEVLAAGVAALAARVSDPPPDPHGARAGADSGGKLRVVAEVTPPRRMRQHRPR